MKMTSNLKLKVYLIVFHLLSFATMAQDDDNPGFPGEDPGTQAPIDNWIFPMVLLGIGMMVYYMKKKQFTES
jgi:hypothetical protein